jgi:hypothetical protein
MLGQPPRAGKGWAALKRALQVTPAATAAYGATSTAPSAEPQLGPGRPAGAATLDTFYGRLRQHGGRACRPRLLPADQTSEARRSRLATCFGLRHAPGGVGSMDTVSTQNRLWKQLLWLHRGGLSWEAARGPASQE